MILRHPIQARDHAMQMRRGPEVRQVEARVGVVVPAHDEEASIVGCIEAIDRAARRAALHGIRVDVFIVCDDCSDATPTLVVEQGLTPIVVRLRNVGSARAAGAAAALSAGAQWLAFTDADTFVSPTWIVDQLDLCADAVCGTVGVSHWGEYGARMQSHFLSTYTDVDDHRHIHGANFGISADAYRRVGGFQALASSEDVALVHALIAAGLHIAWSSRPRVTTSARRTYRAPDGFGATLERVAASFLELGGGHEPHDAIAIGVT